MKTKCMLWLTAMLLISLTMTAQTYDKLWTQVQQARQQDLPQTAIGHLEKIETAARRQQDYGQLLKSTLLHAQLQAEVAPDSLRPAVERLEQQARQSADEVLRAVYATVLATIYEEQQHAFDDWQTRSADWRRQATAHPELLAAVKADVYQPLTVTGKDSRIFGHDLLSVVGQELQAWQWLNDYYARVGNRPAACLSALHSLTADGRRLLTDEGSTAYVRRLDSLIALYGDLPECGEVAIERYEAMERSSQFSLQQKADWIRQATGRWASWPRTASLRNSWSQLTAPHFSVSSEQSVVMPQSAQHLAVEMRNLVQLSMRVYRTTLDGETQLDPADADDYQKMKGGLSELKDLARTYDYMPATEYDFLKDTIRLEGLPAGIYLLEFSTKPATQVVRRLYYVSNLRLMSLPMPQNRLRYVVVDAREGRPVAGARLKLKFDAGWRKPMTSKTITCDKDGEAIYTMSNQKQPAQVFAFTPADKYCPVANLYGRYMFYQRRYDQEHTSLFTDRSIYRPGQTVRVAAIVWRERSATDQEAVAGKTVRLELRDANYRVVGEREVLTDRYGKCSTEFTLPEGLLSGHFTIRTAGASAGFRVEEYKRPTFQVTFDDYLESYQRGDTVRARARALTFAGVPVQGATVKYRVQRRVAFWWLQYSRYWEQGALARGTAAEPVAEGLTTTAADGSFEIPMPLVLPAGLGGSSMFYQFVAEADVTDVGGETHSGSMMLPLGSKPTALTCNLPQQVRSDEMPPVTFERRNAAGRPIEGNVRYSLDDGRWREVAANSAQPLLPASLKSGAHRLVAVCEQDTVDVRFTVFSLADKKAVVSEGEWFYASHRQFPADGGEVTIQAGAVSPSLHIVYSIFADDREIESGRIDRKNSELLVKRLRYRPEYGNGLLAVFSWVRDGRAHCYEARITRPLPDKRLRLTWDTFRDRLTPGQQEEWRLRIAQPDGRPADASLMAVLYDKSLDLLSAHQWHFAPSTYLPQPSASWVLPYWGGISLSETKDYKPLKVPSLSFSRFDHSVYPYAAHQLFVRGAMNGRLLKSRSPMMIGAAMKSAAAVEESVLMDAAPQMAADVKGTAEAAAEHDEAPMAAEEERPQEQQVQMRENLAETAFCYPALETDSTGQVVLRFTLPESLTTWRFMAVANTADMLSGYIDGEAVAAKQVMVQPNVPRFVRMGDQAEVAARIFNQGETAVSGKARLQLTRADDDALVVEQEMDFTVEAGQSAVVTFSIDGSWLTESLLVCKVTAVGDGFSDGEQHYLPVLSDREMVTRTVPFTQHEAGVKSIDLDQLFPREQAAASNLAPVASRKLTIEYTNNPAWLMVQALPVLGQPWEKSAIDLAASYYSNSLALHLMKQNPQVKKVFEQWKRESLAGNDASQSLSLTSQLSKNQELKDLLLEATPWVADADRESEQRQRLADFFDSNTIDHRLTTVVGQLQKLQHADGSFAWYPGMMPSMSVTVSVAEMLARLQVMTGGSADDRLQQMQAKSFRFLSEEMVKLVAEMKRQEKKGRRQSFPSFTALRWLYLCAISDRQPDAGVKAANDYLIALMKKDIKRQTIYEKALSAVILAKQGDRKTAALYAKSLKEYSVATEEMGRYYDTRRAAYSWYDYRIPTEVAAIEALQTVAPDDRQTVDEMRRWLLQQKRTQTWDTPISTVNAIYAFLGDRGSTLLAAQEPARLAIDGQAIGGSAPAESPVAAGSMAGLGYVKTVVADPQGHTLTATKTSQGTSWGAVYAQFLQKSADVEASESGIAVRREVFNSRSAVRQSSASNSHSSAQQSSASASLSVGDRITVRITIEARRDLDYVQVVDRRAACMEPVRQLSGYHDGAYCTPRDQATHYYFDRLPKGKHVIETEYYIDRAGQYETGTCTAGCAYAPEYRATAPSMRLAVEK